MKFLMNLIRLFYKRITLVLIMVGVLLVIAAQGDIPDFGTLEEFFIWVGTGAGSMILAGLVMAYLLENFAWWHDLPRWLKLIAPIILSAVFATLAQSVIVLDLLIFIPAPAQIVVLMMIMWLLSQLGYRSIKEGPYGESARHPRARTRGVRP